MISLLFPQSSLYTVAIVFYTYVCIPLGKLKKQCGEARSHDDDDDGYNLTSLMFRDKEKKKGEEMCCSICLMDYEDEDAVTHLPRCNHLFHVHCIEPWLLRGSLTCPLCRSFVFSPTPSHPNNNVINVRSSSTFHLSLVFIFFFLFLHHLVEYLL
ncbi:RING-H2 finger protein ATL18 [Raphanus sativus]|uniref:RING-H2 finger protein ATL18-like n=1 Tax=Raphanus sativus TaxID=3726 RepID=A0A6J0JUW3_RAPSA|nr:RING-H2 finger protein ATL18-like [Raphanus sativus]KAJ4890104.1 RING-H2 finger protein ATL18 [Raphanus sativus]